MTGLKTIVRPIHFRRRLVVFSMYGNNLKKYAGRHVIIEAVSNRAFSSPSAMSQPFEKGCSPAVLSTRAELEY
jgi:hypothetical protein